jgi:anti-sigma-K factor RskA
MNYESHPQLGRLAAEYVLGTLQPRVRRRLEAVMRRSPAVQAAVDAWSDRLHLLSRIDSPVDPSPEVFARIERRIDQSMPSKAAARRTPLWGWLRPAAGFAFGVMLTLALTTLQWPMYETLTSAPPAATTPHHTVRLLFAPGATVEQMNAALRTVDASIVAGPTPLGLLTVSLPDTQAPERALATLRAQPVVRFAEPVVAPKAAK